MESGATALGALPAGSLPTANDEKWVGSVIAEARVSPHATGMPINMQIISNDAGEALSFPDFEPGSRLNELALRIANALDTTARDPTGSTLERLVGFVGYPDQFALWWDGVTCELGYSSPCGIDMGEIADRLIASDAFALA